MTKKKDLRLYRKNGVSRVLWHSEQRCSFPFLHLGFVIGDPKS